jgi:hypothetical protein
MKHHPCVNNEDTLCCRWRDAVAAVNQSSCHEEKVTYISYDVADHRYDLVNPHDHRYALY